MIGWWRVLTMDVQQAACTRAASHGSVTRAAGGTAYCVSSARQHHSAGAGGADVRPAGPCLAVGRAGGSGGIGCEQLRGAGPWIRNNGFGGARLLQWERHLLAHPAEPTPSVVGKHAAPAQPCPCRRPSFLPLSSAPSVPAIFTFVSPRGRSRVCAFEFSRPSAARIHFDLALLRGPLLTRSSLRRAARRTALHTPAAATPRTPSVADLI